MINYFNVKKQKKIQKIFFLLTLVFMGFSNLQFAKAASSAVSGWAWGGGGSTTGGSTGVGWVDLSTLSIPLYVNTPMTVTGYAWSSNIGLIDFQPQAHCGSAYNALSCTTPVGGSGGVFRTSATSLSGWARIVSVAQATSAVPDNSGGNNGWISFGNNANDVVSINATTGNMSGYAWSEFGAIDFAGNGNNPGHAVVKPTVTITSGAVLVNVRNLVLPQTRPITWSSTGATSCRLVSTPSHAWDQNPIVPDSGVVTAGSKTISITIGMNETFTIICSGPGDDSDPKSVIVTTACYPLECANQTCRDNIGSPNRRIGATAVSECAADNLCIYDTDCQQRTTSTSGWKEAAPN